MTGGTLVISRMIKLQDRVKKRFEELGFTNVTVTGEEKDSLNYVINELRPRLVIIGSGFYKAATPYMMGLLLQDFPKIRIAAVSVSEFPDDVAMWFVWHGVRSYANLYEGYEEFHHGLQDIRQGNDYVAPTVKRLLDECSEWRSPELTAPKRQKEILLMLCNGLSIKEIGDSLQISRRTTEWHLKELYDIFNVNSREELMRSAYLLDVVPKNDLCFYRKSIEPSALPKWAVIKQKVARGLT